MFRVPRALISIKSRPCVWAGRGAIGCSGTPERSTSADMVTSFLSDTSSEGTIGLTRYLDRLGAIVIHGRLDGLDVHTEAEIDGGGVAQDEGVFLADGERHV